MSDLFAKREGTREEFLALVVNYLSGRGIIGEASYGEEFEEDDGYVAEVMEVLDRRGGEVVALFEDVYCRDVQWVVALWEEEKIAEQQRAQPRWQCPCGREYGTYPSHRPDRPYLYELNDDGTFGDCLTAELSAKVEEARCACGAPLLKTLRDQAEGKIEPGQMALDIGGSTS